MIGTNNTGHQGRNIAEHGGVVYASSAEQTAEGVKMILDILGKKLPETKVLLLGIFLIQRLIAYYIYPNVF